MKLEINNLTKSRISKKFLEEVAEKTVKFLKIKDLESLVIIGDARMQGLNKKYRKRNRVTDILAFDYGEIFICLPQAKRQAKKLGHSVKKELSILLIHGILHLAGYRDEKPVEYDRMMKEQEKILLKLKTKNKK